MDPIPFTAILGPSLAGSIGGNVEKAQRQVQPTLSIVAD
jgi:hypothetical protein